MTPTRCSFSTMLVMGAMIQTVSNCSRKLPSASEEFALLIVAGAVLSGQKMRKSAIISHGVR